MRNLGDAERFVAGAIGEPGDRTFLIEVETETDHEWFLVEKRQVAALVLHAAQLLEETGLADRTTSGDVPELDVPGAITFRVGQLDLVYAEGAGYVQVTLHPIEGADDEPVGFTVTAGQLDGMARHAADVIEHGRPACPRCGLAMDPDGHRCPVDNGDLRDHRP